MIKFALPYGRIINSIVLLISIALFRLVDKRWSILAVISRDDVGLFPNTSCLLDAGHAKALIFTVDSYFNKPNKSSTKGM